MKRASMFLILGAIAATSVHAADDMYADPMMNAFIVFKAMESPDIKTCLDSGFRRHTAMVSLMLAKTPDEKIHEYMIADVTDQTVMNQMEDEYKVWATTHKGSAVAQRAFENCLVLKDFPVKLEGYGQTCFNFDLLPALTRTMKGTNVPREKALAELNRQFGKVLDPALINAALDDIYSGREKPDTYAASHLMFGYCLNRLLAPQVLGAKAKTP
jgi:hypothetical protein